MHDYDDLVREYRNKHLREAFELVVDSGMDLATAADSYCVSEYGVNVSNGVAKYMMDGARSICIHGCGELVVATRQYDFTMAHWIADVIFAFLDKGIKTYDLVKYVNPSYLLSHFSPMHERTIDSLCNRVSEEFGLELKS